MKYFLCFIPLLIFSTFSYAQTISGDSLYHFSFAQQGIPPSSFPDLQSKYQAGLGKSSDYYPGYIWSLPNNSENFLFVDKQNLRSGKFPVQVNLQLNNRVVYDSIRIAFTPLVPYFKYMTANASYSTNLATKNKRYDFRFHPQSYQGWAVGMGDTVVCHQCNGETITTDVPLWWTTKFSGFYFKSATLITFDSVTQTVVEKEIDFEEVKTDQTNPYPAELCGRCATYLINTGIVPFTEYTTIINHCHQTLFAYLQDDASFDLILRYEGIRVTGYNKGTVTDLSLSVLSQKEETIDKIFTITGQELGPNQKHGLVIVLYKSGLRRLIRFDE